jgi:hypothetical protein
MIRELLDAEAFTPPTGDPVRCGLRKDLPKRLRRHTYFEAGLDVRHDPESGDYRDRRVFICVTCGADVDESVNKKIRQLEGINGETHEEERSSSP